MKEYDHKKIEKKWQKKWEEEGIYRVCSPSTRSARSGNMNVPKCYVLDMFPYPSGEGLHVGHPKGYIATDIYSRMKKMQGYDILHPMGWDAFGLPAENYAIKNKVHPRVAVEKNIKRFKEQLSLLGFNYDWEREINTTDPEYYRWTQWIFLQMFKRGLAYQSYEPINWCPSCQTGLANEDLDGGACERCGTAVEKKPMRQWVLKITDYAERLLQDLEKLDWPESIKESQKNWIGRSEGAEIEFGIKDSEFKIKTFTTRPDTLFGATYLVLAPEHSLITNCKLQITNWDEVFDYVQTAKRHGEIERVADGREKTGIELKGMKAINPANGEEVPVWVADYVLGWYGTGAIMAVPAHDERDFKFAKKHGLPARIVICPHYPQKTCPVLDEAYVGVGHLVASGKFDGMESEKAKWEIMEFVNGKKVTKYKLRDWVFSRQRYWGEPIPVVHCEKCGVVTVSEDELPVRLPEVEKYEPTGTGESPLADITDWVNTKCSKCGGAAKRETNTMPQWAGSSWYYLRYMDPRNKKAFVGEKEEKYWAPVDVYVGGAEHATRHLIYARFWHKFLFDLGVVSTEEPFKRLQHVGLIGGADGRKMSKRYGNVVNPDDVVATFGADTLRLYEMFMGPFDGNIPWSEEGILGPRRFLERIWRFFQEKPRVKNDELKNNVDLERLLHKTIKKVTEDIQEFRFNTAISALMIFFNEAERNLKFIDQNLEVFLKLLFPFAPHITEEIWREVLENKTSLYLEKWPEYDSKMIESKMFQLVTQVNGRARGTVEAKKGISQEEAEKLARADAGILRYLDGKKVKRVIFVKDRLINFVLDA